MCNKISNLSEKASGRRKIQGYIVINRPLIIYSENIGEIEQRSLHSKNGTLDNVLRVELKDRAVLIECADFKELECLEKDLTEMRKSNEVESKGKVLEFKKKH